LVEAVPQEVTLIPGDQEEAVEAGSGDVLVDLGFPDADERRLRVQLAMRLNELMRHAA
jgi:hypothetical protein